MNNASPPSPAIFISYRRDDAGGYAFAFWRELQRCFGPDTVFFDRDDARHLPSGTEATS